MSTSNPTPEPVADTTQTVASRGFDGGSSSQATVASDDAELDNAALAQVISQELDEVEEALLALETDLGDGVASVG